MKLKVKKINNASDGTMSVSDYVWDTEFNQNVLHQSIIHFLANKRQGNHDTQTRSEVSYSTRKLRAQKGTGNARLGSRRSPNMIGGGVAHGPHPRSYRQKLPKKMKRLALRVSLSDKVRSDNLFIIDSLKFSNPKLSNIKNLIDDLDISGKILLVTENTDQNIVKSVKNLKDVEVLSAPLLNSLEVTSPKNILITKEAVKKIDSIWGGV
jgi:large subunit ribosomal protein L4